MMIRAVLSSALIMTSVQLYAGSIDSLEKILYADHPLWYYLFAAFVAGLFVSFTPCIYPMIPITAGIIHPQASSLATSFVLSLIYVLGMASVYAVLGYIVAISGGFFGAWMGSPWVIAIIVGFLVYMALATLGFYEMHIPRLFSRLPAMQTKGSYLYTFLAGALSGTVASPCVSPALFALLTFAALSERPILGFFLLLSFALGHEAIAVNRKRNMISAADNLNVGYAGNDIGLKDRLERLGITVSEQELLTIIQNYRAFISNSRPALRKTLPNPLPPDLAASLQAGNGKFGPYLDLRGISLQGFNLSVDNVDYATERINLTGANLQGAILSGANFAGAIFDHANLADTQLSGTIFNNASLIGVNLAEQPNPVGQQWPYAIRPTGKNLASFRQADLSGSNLTNGNFYFADLTQAKLTDAILDGADFSRANLTGATLIQSPQQAIFQGDVAGSSVTDRFYDSKYFLYHDVHSGKQWKVRYDRFTTLCHTKLSPTVTLTTSQTMPCLLYRQAHPQTTT